MADRLAHATAKDHIYERRQFEYQTDFKLLACKYNMDFWNELVILHFNHLVFQYFIAVLFDELIHLPVMSV